MDLFSEQTVKHVTSQLRELTRQRSNVHSERAGWQTRVDKCDALMADIDIRIADMERVLEFVSPASTDATRSAADDESEA